MTAKKKKKMINEFYKMKEKGEKVVWITSYDYPTAQFAQEAGVDMILVGDSLGMCVYGYKGTVPVTMDQCIVHSEAVRRAAPDVFVIGDMPFLSYQISCEEAVRNAGRFLKEADCDAIKLEGGNRVVPQIKAILRPRYSSTMPWPCTRPASNFCSWRPFPPRWASSSPSCCPYRSTESARACTPTDSC
jgi:3-methyl-2-oxobutanoate hydroxymethyltransferase